MDWRGWLAAAVWAAEAGVARADDPAAKPAAGGPCAGVYLAVAALSDYRFDGFSESDRRPTWQVTVHCFRNDGWYAGAVFTGVKFLDRPPTPFEMDLYAGRRFQMGRFGVNLELLDVGYPDQRTAGPSYGFFAAEGELSRSLGRLTLTAHADVSPNYSGATGPAAGLKANARYALAPWLSLEATGGRLWVTRGFDRDYWDAGATATWRRLTLDVRYGGADLTPAQCYGADWCASGGSAALTWRILP